MGFSVTLLLLLSLGLPCLANDMDTGEQRARELYENGVILYDEGHYEAAITAWEEAYDLSSRPLLLYNIASAQERLGQWQETLDTLNRYRAFATAEERARLDRRITNLERRIEQDVVERPPVPETAPEVSSVQATSSVGPRLNWLTPTTFTVGAAGLATGTLLGLQARNAREEAMVRCVNVDSRLLCPTSAEEFIQQERVRSIAADASFAIAGASLLGGAALIIWAEASVQVYPGGLLITGRF